MCTAVLPGPSARAARVDLDGPAAAKEDLEESQGEARRDDGRQHGERQERLELGVPKRALERPGARILQDVVEQVEAEAHPVEDALDPAIGVVLEREVAD